MRFWKQMTWTFRLAGDNFDLQALEDLFKRGAQVIAPADGHWYLVMDLPFGPSEGAAALTAGQELLAKMNGIAQAVFDNHENVRIEGVSCRDEGGGPVTQYMFGAGSIRGRARVSGALTGLTSDGTVVSPAGANLLGDQFLDIAYKDEHFDRALYLHGSLPHDWRGLYMVLEAIEDGAGGEKCLIAKKWAADGSIKAFKATANSFKALRLQARHGSVKEGISEPTQTLEQAREMIRTLLDRWGKELSRTS